MSIYTWDPAYENVEVAASALISMSMLANDVRTHILATLNRLATLPVEQWPTDQVRPHHRIKGLYILHATDQLRVFFRREPEGKITINDILRQEALDRFASPHPVAEQP